METEHAMGMTVQKLLLCTPRLIAALASVKANSLIRETTRIAVCQPGAGSWWSVRVDGRITEFIDMAFHRGELYAYDDHRDGLYAIDITVNQSTGDPWVSQIRSGMTMRGRWKPMPTECETRTVTATGQNEFQLFKADFEGFEWTKMATIGDDEVLFLRRRCSRSFCVARHGMPGGRVVFMENDDEDRDWYV
ncbi:hypothetical protein ACP70R_007414 [Stipagrostis hirtigluma subsp. patula]